MNFRNCIQLTKLCTPNIWGLSFVLAFLIVPGLENNAQASCGDYLQHSLTSSSHLPSQTPSHTCKGGHCGSQTPASLPTRDKVLVEDRNHVANLMIYSIATVLGQNRIAFEPADNADEVFLEVSVPPPRTI